MNVDLEFTYHPTWSAFGRSRGFGPEGVIGRCDVDVPEVPAGDAPVRWTVRDREDRTRTLREHGGRLYETVSKCPQGLGLVEMLRMDFRPAKDWDGAWGIVYDASLARSRVETTRLEIMSARQESNASGQNPFVVSGGDRAQRESAALSSFADDGIILIDGVPSRRVPEPVLVRTTLPGGRVRLDVAMSPRKAGGYEEILPLTAYPDAIEALSQAGMRLPAKPLVVGHDEPAPAPMIR